MTRIIATLSLTVLAACQAPDPLIADANDLCGASSHQSLVGMTFSAIDAAKLPERTRILHPNTPMTRDYRLDRLNVFVDEAGKVSKVVCG